VAVIHHKGHQKEMSEVNKGHQLADSAAKQAAPSIEVLLPFIPSPEITGTIEIFYIPDEIQWTKGYGYDMNPDEWMTKDHVLHLLQTN
jgi:hypothetical protein